MTTTTPNLGLTLWDSTTDLGVTFQNFRLNLTGPTTSNMITIDTAYGNLLNLVNNTKGAFYLTATGTNNYIATSSYITAYFTGLAIVISVANTNTTISTINISSLGVVNLYKTNSAGSVTPLIAGDLVANRKYLFIYDGTQFVYVGVMIPPTTAINDFQVGDGSGNWIKKTLAETITILRTTLDSVFAPIANGVTNGNSHDHNGGDGAVIPNAGLATVGANTIKGAVSAGAVQDLTPDQTMSILATGTGTSLKIPGDELSLRMRRDGRTFTEFFDVSALPSGWTVQTTAPFTTFTPDFSTVESCLGTGNLTAGNRYFVSRAGIPSAFPVVIACSFGAGNGFVGFRLDDGTDNNYVETGLFLAAGTGIINRRIIYRTGGGAVTTVDSTDTIGLPNGMIILKQVTGTQWTSWGTNARWFMEWTMPGFQSGATTGPSALTWTPSRYGITYRPDATSIIYVDAISY